VLVNLTWLVPGVVGGSEESTTDSLRAVLEHRDDVALRLAVLRPFLAAHPDLATACPAEVLDISGADKARRVLAEQTWLARLTTRLAPDVTHHGGGVLPLRHPGRSTLTVHDLQPLDLPANFSLAKRAYLRAMLGRSARAADVVCVPSAFTRDRVVDLLRVPVGRVRVVPWSIVGLDRAADHLAAGSGTGPSGTGPSGTAGRGTVGRGTAGPVLLYPAITYPHKNHAVLLEAFACLLAEHPSATLVLAGGEGATEDAVRDRIGRSDLRGRVERPGRVGTEEMERLYRRADVVVIPSRYEGFGLPALEAMSRGVPVVVAAAGSLPEVVGDAAGAEPVDPDDVAGWADAMSSVLRLDATARAALGEAGRRRASRFTPQRTADALAGAWHRAAEGAEVAPPHRPSPDGPRPHGSTDR
jgi:alpha-1,3-rhamnosyl/mannosyltransferase